MQKTTNANYSDSEAIDNVILIFVAVLMVAFVVGCIYTVATA